MTNTNANLTINDIAEIIEESPRTIRKALRAHFPAEEQPGRGSRWMIKAADADKIKAVVNEYTARTVKVAEFPAE